MPTAEPSDLELQILGVLWRHGPSGVRQVLELMPDGKKRAYTSILSVMQVMEKKGLLTHATQGNAHVYRPAVSEKDIIGGALKQFVRNVLAGSKAAAIQHLLQGTSEAELAEIRQLIASHRKGGKHS
jgi:predicted transcriptional regulator